MECILPIYTNKNICVRPLTDADMPVVCEWIKQEFARDSPLAELQPEGLHEMYSSISASDFARSFMITMNDDTPVCQIDCCEAGKDVVSAYYDTGSEDYCIYLLLSPYADTSLIVSGLHTWMAWFFSQEKADRLLAPVHQWQPVLRVVLQHAGFELHHTPAPETPGMLYLLTRRHLSEIRHQ